MKVLGTVGSPIHLPDSLGVERFNPLRWLLYFAGPNISLKIHDQMGDFLTQQRVLHGLCFTPTHLAKYAHRRIGSFPQDNWKPPPKRLGFRVLGFRNTIQAWVAYFLAEKRRWKGLATIRFFILCPFTFFEWNLGCGKCFTKWVKSECLRDFSLSETSPSESVLGKGWNG